MRYIAILLLLAFLPAWAECDPDCQLKEYRLEIQAQKKAIKEGYVRHAEERRQRIRDMGSAMGSTYRHSTHCTTSHIGNQSYTDCY